MRLEKKISRSLKSLFFVGLFLTQLFAPGLSQDNLGKGRIKGVVVDEDGAPVEGALIVAQSQKSSTALEGKSDENGRFAIAGLGTGMWTITASRSGYSSSLVEMNVRQLSANPSITFTLKKSGGTVTLKGDQESFEIFEQGNKLINEGKYDEALILFEEFSGKYPELYQVHLNMGNCYLKKGELGRAEEEFKLVLERALEVHGDYQKDKEATLRAFTGLGEVYLRREDFEGAQKYFRKAIEISPEDEVAAYNVGEVFFSNQKIDEAIRYFELAVKIKKDWPKPYLKLGYVYLNKGDFEKSLENFNTFLRLDPENPEVFQVKSIVATIEKIKK